VDEQLETISVHEIGEGDEVFITRLTARDPWDRIERGTSFTAGSIIPYRDPVYGVDVVNVYDRVHHLMLTVSQGRQVQVKRAPRKGLLLNIYRAADGDFTLGGITSRSALLTVTAIRETGPERSQEKEYPLPDGSRISAPTEHAPEAILVIRHRPGGKRWVHLQPAANPGWHYMDGGNYAGTRDGRWEKIAGTALVPVHDRHESAEGTGS
jgi:hypothetical protein